MKAYLNILIITFIVVCTSCDYSDNKNKLRSDDLLGKKIYDLTNKAWKDSSGIIFNLDTLTNFTWDSVIVITPYIPINKLEEDFKINLSEIEHTGITFNDSKNVLAFIKDGRLINYLDLPRKSGDFSDTHDSVRIFSNKKCQFKLIVTDDKFTNGERVVRVKPLLH